MKIAVFSDIHDNLARWREAAGIIKSEGIRAGICCGDVGDLETLQEIAKSFDQIYLAFGNLDYHIKDKTEFFPESVEWFKDFGDFEIDGVKIALVHNQHTAKELAKSDNYDIVFYGHMHTPWEDKAGGTVLLNPGEIAGQYGKPSFCIYDLKKMKAELKLLK
jgi:putative phosphoesterase